MLFSGSLLKKNTFLFSLWLGSFVHSSVDCLQETATYVTIPCPEISFPGIKNLIMQNSWANSHAVYGTQLNRKSLTVNSNSLLARPTQIIMWQAAATHFTSLTVTFTDVSLKRLEQFYSILKEQHRQTCKMTFQMWIQIYSPHKQVHAPYLPQGNFL